jgi:hypothetical protein
MDSNIFASPDNIWRMHWLDQCDGVSTVAQIIPYTAMNPANISPYQTGKANGDGKWP